MAMGTGLFAIALTGTVAASAVAGTPAGPGDDPISCQIRVLTMDGLSWRSEFYSRLTPVARQGTSAVWTADRALAETLTVKALTATVAPVCTNPGVTTVDLKATTCYVAHLERIADGPKNQATAIAFQPETASVDEGFHANVSGRKIDQGILARVAIEESHVKTMHLVRMSETYATNMAPAAPPARSASEVIDQFLQVVQEKTSGGKPEPKICVQIQVPEIAHARVEGEWLIPRSGVLVVSLGVETVADDAGKAVVHERVAVLEVTPPSKPPILTLEGLEATLPGAVPTARLSAPAVPDRMVPVAVDPSGRVVEISPLPEAVASTELDQIQPDPRMPSGQAPHVAIANRPRDPRVARAGLEAPIDYNPVRQPEAAEARPIPPIPARSYPEAIDASGQVFELPPLPEGVASADLNRIPPDPRLPSGQSPHVASEPFRDPQLARVRFEPIEPTPSRRAVAPSPTSVMGSLGARGVKRAVPDDLDESTHELVRQYFDRSGAKFEERVTCDQPGCTSCGGPAGSSAPVVLGVSMKDRSGTSVFDSSSRIDGAFRNPGQTETQYIPVGGDFSLEIKAKLVPRSPGLYKDNKKIVEPAANP